MQVNIHYPIKYDNFKPFMVKRIRSNADCLRSYVPLVDGDDRYLYRISTEKRGTVVFQMHFLAE